MVFPAATVRRGLTLPDPGRREHHSPWDVQTPDVLHRSVFTLRREESCSSLGKMFSDKTNKRA